jgi:hypothetical protein
MKARHWWLLMFPVAVLTGCQSLHVQSAYDQKADFASLHSFCWVAPPSYVYNDPRLKMDQLEPVVREDVQQQLHSRGFTSTDCATADFQVSFRAALRDRIVEGRDPGDDGGGGVTIYEYNSETGGQWWTSRSPGSVNVEREGSLIILIINPKTQRVLWNGSAMASLRSQVSPQQRKERLAKVIQQIMEQFPPTAKK